MHFEANHKTKQCSFFSSETLLQAHRSALSELCRICSNRAQTHKEKCGPKKAILITSRKDKVLDTYGIDISTDTPDVHPTHICTTCTRNLYDTKASIALIEKRRDNAAAINALWTEHTDNHCKACCIYSKQSAKIGVGLKGRFNKKTINSSSTLSSPCDTSICDINDSSQALSFTTPLQHSTRLLVKSNHPERTSHHQL